MADTVPAAAACIPHDSGVAALRRILSPVAERPEAAGPHQGLGWLKVQSGLRFVIYIGKNPGLIIQSTDGRA